MAIPQSGILPEGSAHGLFLTLDIVAGEPALQQVRDTLAQVPTLTEQLAASSPSDRLLSVVAVGPGIWSWLTGAAAPRELA